MKVNYFDIEIVDTFENDTPLSIEKMQISAPRLIYNGADNKFLNLLTSSLEFSFIVNDNSEGKYFHLFTGEENRFKVLLKDVSVTNYSKIIWQGYLLPEQFSEPYIYNNFSVNFTATDGVGLLKNKEFAAPSVSTKTSVLEVINTCLKQTGIIAPIVFTEALQNVAFNLDYLDLTVDTNSYLEDGKKQSVYSVLNKCVTAIGAQLFSYAGVWYLIGLNKFKEPSFTFKKYTLTGSLNLELNTTYVYGREVVDAPFLANPTISILPPLKKVTTVFDNKSTSNLIPVDVVTHLPVNIDTDVNDRTLKYWQKTGVKIHTFNVWYPLGNTNFDYSSVDFNSYYNGFKATPTIKIDDFFLGPYVMVNNSGNTTTISDLDTNYVDLEDAFFIYGSEDLERFGTLEIEFFAFLSAGNLAEQLNEYLQLEGSITSVADNGSGKSRVTSAGHGLTTDDYINITSSDYYSGTYKVTVIDVNSFDIDKDYTVSVIGEWKINPFKDNFHFAITHKTHLTGGVVDETIYLSNFDDVNVPTGMYDFSISADGSLVKGKLKIDKIAFTDDGYYNIRLYPVVEHTLLSGMLVYNVLNLTLKATEETVFSQTRNIGFTADYDVSLFHSSSRSKLTNRSFGFSDTFLTEISNGTIVPNEIKVTPVSYTKKDISNGGVLWYTLVDVGITDEDYAKLVNGYLLYVVKQGTSTLVEIPSENYTLTNGTEKKISQISFADSPIIIIEQTDDIYLKISEESADLNYGDYWLDKFKRYDVEESAQIYEVLNSMYHDLLHEYNFIVDGTINELVGPLDLINFSFKGLKKYYPLRLQLDLTEGKTQLLMVENKNSNVTDYE